MDLLPIQSSCFTLENYFFKITSRSKVIYWILLGTIICILILLPLIYVDVSVLARGFFQSDIEKQIVIAPFSGKVIFSSVKAGSKINKGDTLLIIESETIKAQKEAIVKRISENNKSISDLKKLCFKVSEEHSISESDLLTPRYRTEYENFKKRLLIQTQKLQKAESDYFRNKYLNDEKLIPDTDFENIRYEYNLESENLKYIILNQRTIWQTELTQHLNESARLEAEYNQIIEELTNRIVTSPLDGEIIQSCDIQVGSMVSANQKLIEISPESELIATCFLKPGDIGMVFKGQTVVIQVDAFNYNEWGMLKGNIIDISDDIITEGSNVFFRVKCRLNNNQLRLKNGYKAEIKKGMSLNARIIVTSRTLFNLLFDKADKWLNPYLNSQKKGENEN